MARTDVRNRPEAPNRPEVRNRPQAHSKAAARGKSGQYFEFSAITIKKRSIALFFMRLPALVPFIFILPGWLTLNAKDTLSLEEANILGTGGEFCFFMALSITPLITVTGKQWIAPLRRWYGIMFAVIGIADSTTASITTGFKGGVLGRLAGHSFL